MGVIFAIIGIVVFFIFAVFGWPGPIHFCVALNHCYCETIQWDALVVQPLNTWSNFGPILAGLYLLYIIDKTAPSATNITANPMLSATFHSKMYGLLVIFIGIGSFYFHGSMTQLGGVLDNISMNTYITFLICYNFQRIFRFSNKLLLSIFCIVNIILGWLAIIPDVGRFSFGILVGGEILFEFFVLLLSKKGKISFQRDWRLYLYSVMVFGFAFLVWQLSKTDALFCYPDSFWQGHALWHYLDGLAPCVIFMYMRSENQK